MHHLVKARTLTLAKVRPDNNTDVKKQEAEEGSAAALACSEVHWTGVMTCQKTNFTKSREGQMQN